MGTSTRLRESFDEIADQELGSFSHFAAVDRMKKRRIILLALLSLAVCFVFIRSFCGIFVIQPIRVLPEGATILYWRNGLNLPFIASADGILGESKAGVSLLVRAVVFAHLADPIMDRKIVKLGYSETLYLWSTGGRKYQK